MAMIENIGGVGQENEQESLVSNRLSWVFAAGFILIFLGVLFIAAAAMLGGGSANSGVIVFIGPFPIVFGVGPDAAVLILLAVVIAIAGLVAFVVLNRKIGVLDE
jgi:uncharacterized membrane protein